MQSQSHCISPYLSFHRDVCNIFKEVCKGRKVHQLQKGRYLHKLEDVALL